ncbi:MAG: hypothetical protein U9P70_01530 [Patescibacteria group bacterium]|nr:hypothetical protein [Patescibacteria group bacterium]
MKEADKMSKKSIFWMNKKNLSEEAIEELEKIFGEISLHQLSDLKNLLTQTVMFDLADIIAFQLGSLPPELQEECLKRTHITYEIDENFDFKRWQL